MIKQMHNIQQLQQQPKKARISHRLGGKGVKLSTEGNRLRVKIKQDAVARLQLGAIKESLELGESLFNEKSVLRASAQVQCYASIDKEGDKIKAVTTCKQKTCVSCARHRAKKLMLKYAPPIQKLYDLHKANPKQCTNFWMLTLTVPAIRFYDLKATYKRMNKVWRDIYVLARKEGRSEYTGLRKFEINSSYNPLDPTNPARRNNRLADYTYNPHMHLIIKGQANCKWLREQWLKAWPECREVAQVYTSLGNPHKRNGGWVRRSSKSFSAQKPVKAGLMELMKYLSKSFSGKNMPRTWAQALPLAYIPEALKGKRTIYAFGGLKGASEEEGKAWADDNRDALEEALDMTLDAKTNEEANTLRPENAKKRDGRYHYRPSLRLYVSDAGESLTEAQDFDEGKPQHMCRELREYILRKTETFVKLDSAEVLADAEEWKEARARADRRYWMMKNHDLTFKLK